MCRSQLMFALMLFALAPLAAHGQSIEERLSQIEKRLERIEQMLETKNANVGDMANRTVEGFSHLWELNSVTGAILRTDKHGNFVRNMHSGKPGQWKVVTGAGVCWALSAGGTIVRIDLLYDKAQAVYTGKSGRWEIVSDKEGNEFTLVANADSGAVLRFNKLTGETRIIDEGN